MKKDAYYFSHDSNARNDFKILKLRSVLGMEGYGIYFCLIEMLRETNDYKLPLDYVPAISKNLDVSELKVSTVIHDYNLFEVDENHFFSQSLNERMIIYDSTKLRLSEAGRKGGLSKAKARLKRGLSNPLALKESKVKKSKLLFSESVYFDKLKFKEALPEWNSEKLKYYYESLLTWSNEGNKKIDWIATAKTWANRDEAEGKIKFNTHTKLQGTI